MRSKRGFLCNPHLHPPCLEEKTSRLFGDPPEAGTNITGRMRRVCAAAFWAGARSPATSTPPWLWQIQDRIWVQTAAALSSPLLPSPPLSPPPPLQQLTVRTNIALWSWQNFTIALTGHSSAMLRVRPSSLFSWRPPFAWTAEPDV